MRTDGARSPISPPGQRRRVASSVAGRFPLYETAGAHEAVERGGKVGTVIVEPQR
jgi:hypothetical protein